VSLEAFQEAAETRAEDDDPIVTITPDPEEELLQEFRDERGFYGDDEPPELMVEGIVYGATPFVDAGAGGYTYVSQTDGDDGRDVDDGDEEGYLDTIPKIPLVDEEQDNPAEEDEEGDQGTCFVATAAYGDPWHPDVVFLRAFRDQWLVHRGWGRAFIAFYWRVGPKMAGQVRRSPGLARPAKAVISGIVRLLRKVWI
jgi:hypothetical protein